MYHLSMNPDMDNENRADAAEAALNAYADGRYHTGEEFWTVLGDLLNDLRHLVDRYGDDDDRQGIFIAKAEAGTHYEAEKCGDPASYPGEDWPDTLTDDDEGETCGAEDCGGPVEQRPDPGWPMGKWSGQWSADKGWHDGPGRSVSVEGGKLVLGEWPT